MFRCFDFGVMMMVSYVQVVTMTYLQDKTKSNKKSVLVYIIAVEESDAEKNLSSPVLNTLRDLRDLKSLGRLFHKIAPP